MNKAFKTLLLKIATLTFRDQKWLLKQLSQEQQEQFKKLQGNELLVKARRFRKLSALEVLPSDKTPDLPAFCQALRQKPPLYIAIILEQENYSWKQSFLSTIEQGDILTPLSDQDVKKIKPDAKSTVIKHWRNQLSFSDQLENQHG